MAAKRKPYKKRRRFRPLKLIGGLIGLLFIILFICIAIIGGTVGYLTIREYEPASIVEIDIEGEKTKKEEITIQLNEVNENKKKLYS